MKQGIYDVVRLLLIAAGMACVIYDHSWWTFSVTLTFMILTYRTEK